MRTGLCFYNNTRHRSLGTDLTQFAEHFQSDDDGENKVSIINTIWCASVYGAVSKERGILDISQRYIEVYPHAPEIVALPDDLLYVNRALSTIKCFVLMVKPIATQKDGYYKLFKINPETIKVYTWGPTDIDGVPAYIQINSVEKHIIQDPITKEEIEVDINLSLEHNRVLAGVNVSFKIEMEPVIKRNLELDLVWLGAVCDIKKHSKQDYCPMCVTKYSAASINLFPRFPACGFSDAGKDPVKGVFNALNYKCDTFKQLYDQMELLSEYDEDDLFCYEPGSDPLISKHMEWNGTFVGLTLNLNLLFPEGEYTGLLYFRKYSDSVKYPPEVNGNYVPSYAMCEAIIDAIEIVLPSDIADEDYWREADQHGYFDDYTDDEEE